MHASHVCDPGSSPGFGRLLFCVQPSSLTFGTLQSYASHYVLSPAHHYPLTGGLISSHLPIHTDQCQNISNIGLHYILYCADTRC